MMDRILSKVEDYLSTGSGRDRTESFASAVSALEIEKQDQNSSPKIKKRKDYLYLPDILSSRQVLRAENIYVLFASLGLFVIAVSFFHFLFGTPAVVVVSGFIASSYFIIMIFKVWVVYHAFRKDGILNISSEEVRSLNDEDLPFYTILVPLYREEEVIPQIIKAMTSIDYPTDKLEILITLEKYDKPTIEAIKRADPPDYFRTIILPDVEPKTKPKALNVAFQEVKGEYVVIYDAEIIPEEDQLKKAHIAFLKNPDVSVLQTKLDHYNSRQNIITKLFNVEFSFHYDYFLPGVVSLGFPVPLSGHSTHFKKNVLRDIGAWDPYNVTEDCDVGIRLARMGYKSAMINSFSFEEATTTVDSWVRQRTRWMKGFIQTSLVHLREPLRLQEELGGSVNFLAFLLLVPGTVIINIVNLLYWMLLISWFLTQSVLIQAIFPTFILYVSGVSFVVGNFIFIYLNLLGVYGRSRFDLVKYSLLSPFYWLLLAIASTRAMIQMFVSPYKWEKTVHGSHLNSEDVTSVKTSFAMDQTKF
jgi:glycosyltransferase XagB